MVAMGENFAEKAGFSVEVSVRPSHPFLKNLLNFLTLSLFVLSVLSVCLPACAVLHVVPGVVRRGAFQRVTVEFRLEISFPHHVSRPRWHLQGCRNVSRSKRRSQQRLFQCSCQTPSGGRGRLEVSFSNCCVSLPRTLLARPTFGGVPCKESSLPSDTTLPSICRLQAQRRQHRQ